jgi:hypothetical protein
MKTYQNIFHGTIASLLVISGIALVSTLVMCIGVGAGMILGYPSGVWTNLGVSVFVLGLTGALFGSIYHLAQKLFIAEIYLPADQKERMTGKVVQIKRDQPALTD